MLLKKRLKWNLCAIKSNTESRFSKLPLHNEGVFFLAKKMRAGFSNSHLAFVNAYIFCFVRLKLFYVLLQMKEGKVQ